MRGKIEQYFESFLWSSRFLIIIAVLALLVSSLIAFWIGIESIAHALASAYTGESANITLVHLISAIDEFLLGIVMIIMALGIYELFISEIEVKEERGPKFPKWLQFHSLEELKGVLTKVIIIILMVYFFKSVVVMKFDTPLSILYLAAGIILVAFADFLTKKGRISIKE